MEVARRSSSRTSEQPEHAGDLEPEPRRRRLPVGVMVAGAATRSRAVGRELRRPENVLAGSPFWLQKPVMFQPGAACRWRCRGTAGAGRARSRSRSSAHRRGAVEAPRLADPDVQARASPSCRRRLGRRKWPGHLQTSRRRRKRSEATARKRKVRIGVVRPTLNGLPSKRKANPKAANSDSGYSRKRAAFRGGWTLLHPTHARDPFPATQARTTHMPLH